MQMHTPTHHARTPGVAEGGSGTLLANGMEAFQQTAGPGCLCCALLAAIPGREDG
jgi:hydroxyethylthiazole kinase-like sugar kinase family protein